MLNEACALTRVCDGMLCTSHDHPWCLLMSMRGAEVRAVKG